MTASACIKACRSVRASLRLAAVLALIALAQARQRDHAPLTVLAAVFLPLNLITGFFGMNFETFDFIPREDGLLLTGPMMLLLVLGLVFWRRRYIGP